MFKYSVVILVLGLLMGSPAGAQQAAQTPESAVEFLRTVAAAGNMKFRMTDRRCARQYNYWNTSRSREVCHTFDPYRAEIVPSANPCVYTIKWVAPPPYTSETVDWLHVSITPRSSGEATVNWATLAAVTQDGMVVRVPGRSDAVFASEALATRGAYAMEFLRNHCDPTAATGF